MIKYFLVVLLLAPNLLMASNKEEIIKLYEQKNYRQTCLKAGDVYQDYKNDEDFLSMFADACVQEDMINRTVLPIIKLYETKKGRENAAYFSTILNQKKLLYMALIDDIDISYINLPKTNYILSIIFNKFVSHNYTYKNGVYWFKDDTDESISYKLSAEEHQQTQKMFLRTYRNNEVIKVRTYW